MTKKDYRNTLYLFLLANGKNQQDGAKGDYLSADMFDGDLFNQYRFRLDAYHRALYNATVRGEKTTQKKLDNLLSNVLALIIPTSEKVEAVVKTFGNHRQLLAAKYGKQLTDEAASKVRSIRADIRLISDSNLVESEKAEKIEMLEDKIIAIRNDKNYKVAVYRNLPETSFRKQFETIISLKLVEAELAEIYSTQDFTTSKKWVSWLARAQRCDGVDLAKVDGFKHAADFDGLKEYVNRLEAAYKLKKLEAAELAAKK